MQGDDWNSARAFAFVVRCTAPDGSHTAAGVLINGLDEPCNFRLPGEYRWEAAFVSCEDCAVGRESVALTGPGIACLAATGPTAC